MRAFGGSQGRSLRFWGSASLDERERIDYDLPLHGPAPSLTFSWEDGLGQAGAVTVKGEQIPYPLPAIDGELCDLRMASLGWTPGAVTGVIESQCVSAVEDPIELQTVAGHESVTETALLDAGVTEIAGTLSAATGASTASVEFVPNGETRFRLDVPTGKAIHAVTVDVDLEAALSIPMPPLTVLTHHPERTEERTETVSLYRPGASDSDSDSETITVTPRRRHDHGAHRLRLRLRLRAGQDGQQGRDPHHRPPGARQGRGGGAFARHEGQGRDPGDGLRRRGRRPLRGPGAAGA